MKKIILMLAMCAMMVSCEKDTVEPKSYACITIKPEGVSGTPYSYNVYCVYERESFDTLNTPAIKTITGVVDVTDPYVILTMDRDEFFYVIAYRVDSVSHSHAIFNRRVPANLTIDATEY